jgi:hypothetical protein
MENKWVMNYEFGGVRKETVFCLFHGNFVVVRMLKTCVEI